MLLAGSFWAYVVVRLVGYRGIIMAAAWNKDAYQTPIQRRHAGTGLDYESYARWLRVGTVVFGLGAAIATGSGVASASTDDADHSPNASASQAAGDESDGGSVANDTSSDTNAAGRGDDSDQNTADDADEVDESLADELADDESADDVVADDVAADEAVDDEAVDDDAAANSDVDPDSDAASGEDAPATEDLEAVTDTKAASSDEDADETHTVQIEPVRQQTTPAEDVDAGEEAAETGQTAATAQASRSETTPTTTYTTTLPDSATTLRSTAASAAAAGRQQEAVTLNAIVTDIFHWVGLGSQAGDLPVPATPVSMLVQSLWLFVRDVQYTWNNQRPNAAPTISGRGPDGTITGSLNAVDYDDANLTYIVTAQPGHGTVSVDAEGNFTYTPADGTVAGTDTFTVTIDDRVGNPTHFHGLLGLVGAVGPRQAVIRVSLTDSALPTEGRQSDVITLKSVVTDVLHWVGLGSVANRLTLSERAVSPGFESLWRFVRELAYHNDNQRPTANPTTVGQGPDGTVTGTLNAVDYDDLTLSYTVSGAPAHGSVTVDANGDFVYVPDAATAASGGTDRFTVVIDDTVGTPTHYRGILGRLGLLGPRRVTVSVRVEPIGPQTIGDGYAVDGTDPDTGVVTGSTRLDNAGTVPLTYVVDPTSGRGGTVTVDEDGRFTYTPSADARHAAAADGATPDQLTDTFTIVATDGYGGVTTVAVTVAIDPANTAPVATVQTTSRDETGAVTGTVTVTDPDGDSAVVTAPASTAKGGTVVFDTATGQFSYTPSDDARHAAAADGASPDDLVDTFAVTVDDGHGGTTVVPVTVTLVPVNADPVATVTVGARDENGVVTGTVSATDADGDAPRFSGPATSAKGGTITVDALTGEFTYTPSEEARHAAAADDATAADRTDTFLLTAADGHGGTAEVLVVVTLDPVNTPLSAGVGSVGSADPVTGQVTGSITVTDPDGDAPAFTTPVTSAKGGTVSIDENGVFTYIPTETARHAAAADNATADDLTDTFDITVNDGHGGTTTQTITVAIDPANAAPTDGTTTITGADTATGQITGTVAVTDPDGDTTTYSASTSVKGGTVTIDSITGEFTYTPTEAARHAAAADNATADDLIDTFAVTVDDGHGGTAIIAVIVNIDPANAAPSATYTVGSFNNGDFAVDLSGWTVVESVVRLDGTGTIAGWPTPIDPTTAPDGGTETTPLSGTYVVRLVDGRVVLESTGLTVPNTPAGSGGVVHGPAVVSNDPVRINSGATVQFDWEASGGADAYDVLGYILNVDTGGTSIILDATGATYNASQPVTQVNYTVTETGNFVFVFVAGTWDATRGQAAGARLSIDNVKVLNNSGANPGQVTGLVNGVDPDGDTLTYSAPATTALGGAVTIDSASGQFTYTASAEARHAAAAGGSLIDTFEVTVTDGHGGLTTVVVSAPIEPANTAPAVTSTVDAPNAETGAVTGMIVVSDADGDSPAFTVSPSAKGGTVTIDPVTGRFTYTPTDAARHAAAADDAPVAERTDTFAVTVDDGHGGTTTTTVSVAIAPANSAPTTTTTVGDPDSVTGAVTGTVTASDADGDTLTYAVSPTAKGGTIVVDEATGEFVYLPTRSARDAAAAADADADDLVDTFDITVNDGHGGITSVTVTVAVSPRPNTAPDSLALAFSGSDEDLITYLRANQAAAPASPSGGRNVISAGDLFLGGNFIEIGLSQKGSFGTSSNKPAGFFATAGSNRLGLSNDVDGFGNGVDSRIDFFMPGTPEERWSVGYNDTQSGGFSALTGDGGTAGALTGVSLSDGSTGDTLSGTFVATVGGVLQTVQVHTFKVNDSFFQTVVTLTNVSDATLTNVEYMRSFDPDNTVYQGGDFVTTNTVRGQFTTDGVAAVTATSAAGDNYENLTGQQATILYLSNDPGALVYTGGFANSDPYAFDSVDQPTGFSQSGDQAIGIIFKAGDLAAGESATFTYYTALSTDENVSAVVSRINTASVTEGSPGAAVGMVTANDPDPDEILTFTVSDARFEVVPSGGTNILKLRDEIALDYAAEPTVTLSITATDTVGASISQVFTINVLEGNVVTL